MKIKFFLIAFVILNFIPNNEYTYNKIFYLKIDHRFTN